MYNEQIESRSTKRPRKNLFLTHHASKELSGFLHHLNSSSIVIADKRPNTTVKDLEIHIRDLYDVHRPECFLMNGEEYSGDQCLHQLTRDKYLYVPVQVALDVEVTLFSIQTDEVLLDSLKFMKPDDVQCMERNIKDKIRYGVNIINFQKKRVQKTEASSQTLIPHILRGNSRENANEAKIDEMMRLRLKSPIINIKKTILQFKQSIENELMVNLEKVDVYDLYKFQKLPEHLPLQTFITMAKNFSHFVLSFRFKQMPKSNNICIVINQVTPIPEMDENGFPLEETKVVSEAAPKTLLLFSLDETRSEKEQWTILENFTYGCKKEDPSEWSSREIQLWINYIRNTFKIEPKNQDIHRNILNGGFMSAIYKTENISQSFQPKSPSNSELCVLRFMRHCELLLKYKQFYHFIKLQIKPTFKVCNDENPSKPNLKTKRPIGRSKAKRDDLVKLAGVRRESQYSSKNIMEKKLGQSLYSGQNSLNLTNLIYLQNRRWSFFLNCLVTPARANDIAWIDYDMIFQLVDQEAIARLFGHMCQKPEMTYDKLSRGLRYDRSGLIDKADKNFCWKFTVPIEEILGMNIDTIIKKMYKYFKKINSNYPTEILLKESLAKKKAKPIGNMHLLIRDPIELIQEDHIERLQEMDYQHTYSSMGYMSTDKRINFWISPKHTTVERNEKRIQQGRPVHSVIPNEPEFISLTSLNTNRFISDHQQHSVQNHSSVKLEMKEENTENNIYDNCPEVEEELEVEYLEEYQLFE